MKYKTFLHQLLKSYLIIAIIPITVLIGYLFYTTSRAALDDAQKQVENIGSLSSSQFESQCANLSFLSLHIVSNQKFRQAAQKLNNDEPLLDTQQNYAIIESTISTYSVVASAYDVSFFSQNGFYATSRDYNHGFTYKYRLDESEPEIHLWMEQANENYGQALLLPIADDNLPEQRNQSLALVRSIRNPGKNVGYLAIEISMDNLSYIFQPAENQNIEMKISTADGTEVYRSAAFPAQLNADVLQKKYLYASCTDTNGIETVCVISKAAVQADAWKKIQPLLIVSVFLISVTMIGIVVFGKKLTRPLATLARTLQDMTLDSLTPFETELQGYYYKEIYELDTQFLKMRKRLSETVQKEIAIQTLHVQERFHSLQAQMNPHFLYNTLNIIGIMGIEADNQAIYDACVGLSSIMRYAIADRNMDTSSLQQELDNIHSYLELMRLRYEHRMQYKITVEDRMLGIEIPRLTLQPLVENIFAHAYDDVHTSVSISVRGWLADGRWYLQIADNGVGITGQKLQSLRREIDTALSAGIRQSFSAEETGIGLKNTLLRASLFFGADFSYLLNEGTDGGTVIRLSSKWNEARDLNEKNTSADCRR